MGLNEMLDPVPCHCGRCNRRNEREKTGCWTPRPITAETLTDEEIRALQRSIAGHVFPASGMAHTGLSDLWHDTEVALCELDLETSTIQQRRAARERIAAYVNAINARKG